MVRPDAPPGGQSCHGGWICAVPNKENPPNIKETADQTFIGWTADFSSGEFRFSLFSRSSWASVQRLIAPVGLIYVCFSASRSQDLGLWPHCGGADLKLILIPGVGGEEEEEVAGSGGAEEAAEASGGAAAAAAPAASAAALLMMEVSHRPVSPSFISSAMLCACCDCWDWGCN